VKVLIEIDKSKIKNVNKERNKNRNKFTHDFYNFDEKEFENIKFDSLLNNNNNNNNSSSSQQNVILQQYLQTGIAKIDSVVG
jgi:hypothetical protein